MALRPRSKAALARLLLAGLFLFLLAATLSLSSPSSAYQTTVHSLSDSSCSPACHVNNAVLLSPSTSPVVREYTFNVAHKQSSHPDGVIKTHVLVNDLMPGPTIRANRGDTIVVHVNNNLANESTSVHFHGVHHRGSNSMDGVPGVTQCGIPPGHSFTYRFTINQSGTFWWHSHSVTQRIDGMAGAMIVNDPENDHYQLGRDYDDEAIVFIQDYYHQTGEQRFEFYLSRSGAGFEPVPENGLINGRGYENLCSRAHFTHKCDPNSDTRPFEFRFVRGRRYRLRVINAGALAEVNFSLDNHVLTIIEADTSESEPADVHFVPIAPGQRYSAIVTAAESGPDVVTMRADMNTNCFNYHNSVLNPEIRARVALIDPPSSPAQRLLKTLVKRGDSSPSRPWDDVLLPDRCIDLDPSLLRPVAGGPFSGGQVPAMTRRVALHTKTLKLERVNLAPFGFINRTSFMPAIGAPNLHVQLGLVNPLAETVTVPTVSGRPNTDPWGGDQLIEHVELSPDAANPTVIELVINNPDESAHPFHLHGHEMYVVRTHSARAGLGPWKPKYISEYKTADVLPRDTITVPRLGHAVVRFVADNPGFWAFHCHILWHLRAGMMMQFAVGVEQLERQLVNKEMTEQCRVERELGEKLVKELPGNEYKKGMIPAT